MANNEHSGSKKRIAKNTVVLYIRMIVVMLITLYTSRVVLKALGVILHSSSKEQKNEKRHNRDKK